MAFEVVSPLRVDDKDLSRDYYASRQESRLVEKGIIYLRDTR